MTKRALHVVIRTPTGTVMDDDVAALRVPTQSGQVGLRPRGEPTVLVVEAGLIVLRRTHATNQYAGTAGGLLHADRRSATLMTPLAVVGDDVRSVSRLLDELLEAPSAEMEIRRTLGRLESRILQEVRREDSRASVKDEH